MKRRSTVYVIVSRWTQHPLSTVSMFLHRFYFGFLLMLLIYTNREQVRKLKHKVWGLTQRENTSTDSCLRIQYESRWRDGVRHKMKISVHWKMFSYRHGWGTLILGWWFNVRSKLNEWNLLRVHYLCWILLNNYAQCVDIAVKYFANVNIGELYCWNLGIPDTLRFVY